MKYGIYVLEEVTTNKYIALWLSSYDPDGNDGIGATVLTDDPNQALAFDGPADAMAVYYKVSTSRPSRLDGKPNRPLTAFTISIRPLLDSEQP